MAGIIVGGTGESRRVRMAPDDRERMILEEAVRFFARHGFAAQIRDLAAEAGISQGLVYRYFRSKRELLERVYEHNFIKRWDDSWEEALKDRSEPLDARLTRFYSGYLKAIDDPDWIRLVMYSGLERNDLTRRYIRTQVERLLQTIALECRMASGRATSGPVSELETEAVWHLHSTFIYYLVRKHIFAIETTADRDALVRTAVTSFLQGVGAVLAGDPGKGTRKPLNGNGR
jgi:AcrR family transcriptional regulator